MKNNFSHVSVALFMLIFLTACGSQLTDSITEESGTNAITVMKPDDILATADEAAYSSYSTEDTNSKEISLSEHEWKEMYLDYIGKEPGRETMDYGLIYINEDDIPELVIRDEENNSVRYITCSKNGIDILETPLVALTRDRENLLELVKRDYNDYSVSTMIYQIADEKWERIHDCLLTEANDDGMDASCTIDGIDIASQEYDAKLEEIFSWIGAVAWNHGATYNQIHAYLRDEVEEDYKNAFRKMVENGEFSTEFTNKPFDEYVCLDLGNDGSMELIGASKNTKYDMEIGIATFKDGLASKVYSWDLTDDMLIVDIDKGTMLRIAMNARHIDYFQYSIHDGSSFICYSIEGEPTSGAPSDEPYSFELDPDETGYSVNNVYKSNEEGKRYLEEISNSFSSNLRLIALRSFSNEYVPDNISFLEFADLESALQ